MLGIIIVCLLVEGFFSGSEIAVVSLNRAHLKHLVEKGSPRAKALDQMLRKPEWFLGTTLLGTNIAAIALNSVATLYVIERFGVEYQLYTILFTAPLILLFGEVLPKTVFQAYSDRLAPHLVFPLRVASVVLRPIVFVVAKLGSWIANRMGVQNTKHPLLTKEELQLMFRKDSNPTHVKELERKMIDRIFSFSEHSAREIMIPLVKIVSVAETAHVSEASAIMRASGFSRIPVFSGRAYNIVGWVNQYDLLLSRDPRQRVGEIMRTIRYVPETIQLDHLLVRLQKGGDSIASVVDEYGGTIGLVTMEDILEEVVGEIEDEHDTASVFIRKLTPTCWIVNARIPLEQLNEILPTKLPEGDYETIGGFLSAKFQRVPKVGDLWQGSGIRIEIRKATDRSVEEIELNL